jgi:hypothetical protein
MPSCRGVSYGRGAIANRASADGKIGTISRHHARRPCQLCKTHARLRRGWATSTDQRSLAAVPVNRRCYGGARREWDRQSLPADRTRGARFREMGSGIVTLNQAGLSLTPKRYELRNSLHRYPFSRSSGLLLAAEYCKWLPVWF